MTLTERRLYFCGLKDVRHRYAMKAKYVERFHHRCTLKRFHVGPHVFAEPCGRNRL